MKIVQKTSRFPASREEVFAKLQKLSTLQYIAKPFAYFYPAEKSRSLIWREGEDYIFVFRLFGFIPMGIHRIHIERFDKDIISSREGNKFVPLWNHTIYLKQIGNDTQYTDEVRIEAGWKTIFVYLWAKAFYAHRQKRWIRLLNKKDREN